MKTLVIVILAPFLFLAVLQETPAPRSDLEKSGSASTIYDPDPNHIWNRLYDVLLIRRDQTGAAYGVDALDPLLWWRTEHSLAGSSNQNAQSILDEFLRTHGENEIRDPIKMALFQHNLWAVFDWSAIMGGDHAAERRELQIRLAEVLRRLALTSDEIKSLPDNYTQAAASGAFAREYDPTNRDRTFLPPDLLQPRGPWVCIKGDPEPVALTHVGAVSGRSRFLVFVRLPQGRQATLDYFHALWKVPEPWVASEFLASRSSSNPNLAQFPVGTQVAILRQMMLLDSSGSLVPTRITESVQIRVYRAITARHDQNNISIDWPAARVDQDFYEVRLSQAKLFAGQAGGLKAIAPDETEFPVFQTQGHDVFEDSAKEHVPLEKPRGRILDRCVACHSAPGINSLQTLRQLLKPHEAQLDPDPPYDSLWWETQGALVWKSNHYDWGLLNGYWQASSGSH
ncbi:MAG: hypothetical protein ABSH52_18790 [Terriglobia bacterium]|jgi:hypothetical protein